MPPSRRFATVFSGSSALFRACYDSLCATARCAEASAAERATALRAAASGASRDDAYTSHQRVHPTMFGGTFCFHRSHRTTNATANRIEPDTGGHRLVSGDRFTKTTNVTAQCAVRLFHHRMTGGAPPRVNVAHTRRSVTRAE